MKANLPSLEPAIQTIWDEQKIYHRIQELRKDAPSFVLHDGPPYTNSPIHTGTAMNKILKDFVLKSRTMMGFRCPYVPGFDNHGLPIEQTVAKKFAEKKEHPSVVELRKACRAHAAEFVKVQSEQFQRLGVFGLWEKPYTTMNFRFEAEIVRVFRRMVEGGHVYKGLRPTLWSTTSRTALADTEIEYHDHVSKAIYVRFPLLDDPNKIFTKYPNLYTIIWTTTPWTIPANLAVAFHPEFEYAVVEVTEPLDGKLTHYLIFDGLVEKVGEALGWENPKVLARIEGVNFEKTKFRHPIFDRPSVSVMATYVTTEDGTGVVHTAPSHGRDDFYTGLAYNLPVPNTVDERGYLTHEAGEFEGVFYQACDTIVVDRLKEVKALLKVSDYSHSYPYAERDGKPVIFRATEQWFIAIDPLRTKMLQEIKGVKWYPEQGFNRIDSMVRNRPDWCISRQRPWGVGIPIFYGAKSRKPVLDPVAIEKVAQLVEKEGSDAWFEKDPLEILPAGYKHPETGETEFVKETDVLDVWFDSGSTSLCVLEGNVEPEWKEHWPADVYLEGSDQHRGWFNSSLVLGVGTRGHAPYKAVVTHGFVLDEKYEKMSKRKGNTIEPIEACQKYGADILRYWLASVDYSNDVPFGDNILKQFGEGYRNVRNAVRFLMGNLSGFTVGDEPPLLAIDKWVEEQVDLLTAECIEAYQSYNFSAVINAIHNFCRDLSGFYMDVIKDRMYCEATDSLERRSGQAACLYVLKRLIKLSAPILPHTAEESWTKLHEVLGLGEYETIHAQVFDMPTPDRLSEIEDSSIQEQFASILVVRSGVNAAFEQYKGTDGIKNSQDVTVTITEEGDNYAALSKFTIEELAIFFRVSWVELKKGASEVEFQRSAFEMCSRSRLRRPDVQVVEWNGEQVALSARDRRVLGV